MHMAYPTSDDRAERTLGPLSSLPCQTWHGYGISCTHHGEVSGCRRACKHPPSPGAAAAAPPPAGGRRKTLVSGYNMFLSKMYCHSTSVLALINQKGAMRVCARTCIKNILAVANVQPFSFYVNISYPLVFPAHHHHVHTYRRLNMLR
jgi:hypothetical protein